MAKNYRLQIDITSSTETHADIRAIYSGPHVPQPWLERTGRLSSRQAMALYELLMQMLNANERNESN